jgi:hypothetical protein
VKKAIVAAATAAVIAGGISAEAAKHKVNPATKCATPRGETLVGDGDTRVYTVQLKPTANTDRTAIYACRFKTGKRFSLGVAKTTFDDAPPTASSHYIRQIRLSGDYGDGVGPGVAYVTSDCTATKCSSARVIVKSLRTGKNAMNLKAGGPFDQVALSQPTDQGGFALAWLETSPDGSCDAGCRVHLVKKKGGKVLGSGTDIDSDVFGLLDDEGHGIIASGGSNSFIWKQGDTIKLGDFNG